MNLFRFFLRQRQASAPVRRMSPQDAAMIRRFAEGDKTLRAYAIAIHRHYIPILGVRGTPEQDFMAEVDNPSPDLIMRAYYRGKLLEQKVSA